MTFRNCVAAVGLVVLFLTPVAHAASRKAPRVGPQPERLFSGSYYCGKDWNPADSNCMVYTDLKGFPTVTWSPTWARLSLRGATATPDGTLYLTNYDFWGTTTLYRVVTGIGDAAKVVTLDCQPDGLGWGRGQLYGYVYWSSPSGIYDINLSTGACTFLFETVDSEDGRSLNFDALDYNPLDDHLYGYDGTAGLYRIDIDTGESFLIASTFPASNTAGTGLAVGHNIVYLQPVYGDLYWSYDLSQGSFGTWTPFNAGMQDDLGGLAFIAATP